MPRVKDPFRKHVIFLSKVRWKCNFCGEVFGGGGTRIKAHLGGIGKRGIKECEKVRADVKAEAGKLLMPRKVMDSSDRGVSEERIQGNVTAALTSRSDLPNVEGGTPLQFAEASVPPQDPIIPHQSINNKTSDAQQNTTVPLPSCNIHLVPCLPPAPLDMDAYISSSSQVPNDAPPSPHIPPSRTGAAKIMVSPAKSIAWKFVERKGKQWCCPYCKNRYGGGVNRVRNHLIKIEDKRISICKKAPDCIGELMKSLLDQGPIPNKEDIAWKFVERQLGDDKWRCHHCKEEFFGDATAVKRHLLGGSNEGISICREVPDTTRKLMLSLFEEAHGNEIDSSHPLPSDLDIINEQIRREISQFPNDPDPGNTMSNRQRELLDWPICSANSPFIDNLPFGTIEYHDDYSQSCGAEVVPIGGNISSINPVPRTSDSRNVEPIAVDFSEGAINAMGPSSSQASVPPQDQIIPHQSMNNKTSDAQQNTTVPSSSCNIHLVPCLPQAPFCMDPYISSSSSQVSNDAPPSPHILPSRTGRISSLPDMNEGAPTASHANKGDNFEENRALKRKLEELCSRVAGIRDELEFAASLSVENQRREVENWLPDAEKFIEDYTGAASKGCLPPHEVNKLKRKAEDLLRQGKFPKGLFEARKTKVSKFLEGKMVGEAFKRNTTKILEYLVGNQVSRLGIYGMGGVGKTTVMKHIHNRLLEKANYGNVFWITVSKYFNTQKLQDDIWKALGLDTLQETDVNKRAAMLHDRLMKRGKCTLILDDVWEHFDLEELGIPIREDGFQLALTARSFYVCRQMQCQEIIKIEPLSPKEAESLFLEELGSEGVPSLEIKPVAESIVEECAGLPLGVITIARSMRGVTQLFMWKDLLVKLRESSMGQTDMEKKVLMNLKFSYDSLDDHEVQQCFLSCALYPEDELIGKLELIELFIDQRLISELDTRKQQYDRGLTILSILENFCLLEDHEENIKMHDLIRDMALHIISATSMVKAGKQLTRIPSEECWMDALERVSLMENDIKEFPLDMSPNCPKLSVLLLNNSLWQVSVIPDSFFQKIRGLEVLNLSGCIGLTELPNSISDLVNLRALLLRGCFKLRHIPSVAKLTSLRKLDARDCTRLEEIEGLEMLVSLRYLDLSDTRIKSLPKETFRRLLKLQYLKVRAPIKEDITYLGALETLECCFRDANDFNECVRVIGQRNNSRYHLTVSPFKSFYWRPERRSRYDEDPIFNLDKIIAIVGWSDAIVSVGGECAGNFILIPRDVQKLTMWNCGGRTNLAGMDPLKCLEELIIAAEEDLRVLSGGQDEEGIDIRDSPATIPSPPLFPSLRRLEISYCLELKHLFGYGSNFPLPHLREIHINDCPEMEGIMATVASPPPCPNPAFPSLEKIVVSFCRKMKRVVESEWLPHFPNLREIAVEYCRDMEEIIGGPPPNMTVGEIPLESLEVKRCDEMRMLFTHEWLIHLRNLQRIRVDRCRGMVEMISSGAGQSQEGSTRSEAGQSQGGSIMTPVTDTSSRSSISLPKLTHLRLCDLPRLQSICEVSVTCDSIEYIRVGKCPELKGIPLQLRLRDIEDLPYIWVDDEESWKMLTWDRPNAQAILQSYLRKGEEANKSIRPGYTSQMSPTTIELPGKGKNPKWCF